RAPCLHGDGCGRVRAVSGLVPGLPRAGGVRAVPGPGLGSHPVSRDPGIAFSARHTGGPTGPVDTVARAAAPVRPAPLRGAMDAPRVAVRVCYRRRRVRAPLPA